MRGLGLPFAFALAACATDYVPDTGWHQTGTGWEEGEQARFYERWFGKQLAAMREPPLQASGELSGFTQRYRLTVLPTFTPGFAARVDEAPDGTAVLQWVILDGAGGYAPGEIASRGSEKLTASRTEGLRDALDRANLFGLQQADRREGVRIDPETGDQVITMCVDGTTWLLELANPTSHALVVRSCEPDEEVLRDLINETYALLPPEPFEDVED